MNISKYLDAAWHNPLSMPWRIFHFVRRNFPVDYWFFNGISFPPDMVTILVTKRCNYRCPGCSSSSPDYTKKINSSELTTEKIKNFIKEVSGFKPNIYFNGGEPTLREDLFDLIKYAKQLRLVTALTTNGSLLNTKNIKLIINSRLDFLSVSLDGPASHHDVYRGCRGAYKKLTQGVRQLVQERKKSQTKTPHVRITGIINPSKSADALFVLKKAEELGVDEVAFGNMMFYPVEERDKQEAIIKNYAVGGNHMIGYPIIKRKFPFEIDRLGLKKVYCEIKSQASIPVCFAPNEINYDDYFSFKSPLIKSYCLSPWFIATLLSNGDLTSCQEFVFGNITGEKFTRLWNNKKAKDFRRFRKKRPFPACFRCLEGQRIRFN